MVCIYVLVYIMVYVGVHGVHMVYKGCKKGYNMNNKNPF
jgi:hypothetical protein